MKVILVRKLADVLDGVDVSDREVGDVLDLAPPQANLLVAEGWATTEPLTFDSRRHSMSNSHTT